MGRGRGRGSGSLLALDLSGKALSHHDLHRHSRLLEPLGRGGDDAVETAGADGAHGATSATQDDVSVGALGHAGRRLDLEPVGLASERGHRVQQERAAVARACATRADLELQGGHSRERAAEK